MTTRAPSFLATARRVVGLTLACLAGWVLVQLAIFGLMSPDLGPSWFFGRIGVSLLLGIVALVPLGAIVAVFTTSARRYKVVAGLVGGLIAAPLLYYSVIITFIMILSGAVETVVPHIVPHEC